MSDLEFRGEDNREFRRRRRRRNQLLAYTALVVFLLLITVAGGLGVKAIAGSLEKKAQKQANEDAVAMIQESTEQVTEVSEASEPEESVPESVEEETTAEPIKEYTEEELLNEVVDSCIAEMSLEDKVAGLFIVTPEALTGVDVAVKAGDGTKEALSKYPVGGLIYFKQNIRSKEQITEMLANTTAMSKYPIFLAVDEEGASISRVAEALSLDKIDSCAKIGESNDSNNAYAAYQTVGTYLVEHGFNLNFAPVADVLTNPDSGVIGERSFGSDAELVSSMVAASVQGLEETGVTACVKHFPGMGNADKDPHKEMSSTDRTLEQIRETELKPFVAGIEAGAQMIMVGHVAVPDITGDNTPASLSKDIITDILREEMGYNGVVITDALNMTAVSDYFDSAQAAIMALKAGADMILMPEDFEAAYEGVIAAVKDGTINEARINDSLARVYRIKYKETVEK